MFNVLICLKQLDNINLAPMLERLYNHTKPQQIHIITSSNNANLILNLSQNIQEKIYIFDEDKIYKNLSLEVIQKYMESKNAAIWRSGWYLQQFLKMGYATFANSNDKTSNALLDMGGGGDCCPIFTPYYLIWDTDCIALNDMMFFHHEKLQQEKPENLTTYFAKHGYIHKPYFDTLERLQIPIYKQDSISILMRAVDFSFIVEHMMINNSIYV